MGIVTAITDVFSALGSWIVEAFTEFVVPMFWTATAEGGSLTLLGTLGVCGLAVSICFLLIGIVQRFMHFGA